MEEFELNFIVSLLRSYDCSISEAARAASKI